MKKSVFKYIIIEDDKNIWKNITARMERYLQWSPVSPTDNLEEAIELIQTHRPELIFTDWSIRGGNSYPILSHIHRKIYPLYYLLYRLPRGESGNPSSGVQ